jgi:hypothetical protein
MTTPYTNIPNSIIQDTRLSSNATGLLCYMLSMPEGWKFNLQDLSRRKKDGRRKTRGNLQELIETGYVKKVKTTNQKGQITGWEWRLNPECQNVNLVFQPQMKNKLASKNQMTAYPHVDKSTSGKQHTSNYPKKEINQKNIFKSDKNFSLNQSSENGASENTKRILENYEAYFGKEPSGKNVWIKYLNENKNLTPEIIDGVFKIISDERMRQEDVTGFKNMSRPTLPEVKRAIGNYMKAKQRAEEGKKKQEQQKPVSHSGHQANHIPEDTGAATAQKTDQAPEPQETCKAITPIPVQPAQEPLEAQEKSKSISFRIPDDKAALAEALKKFPDLDEGRFIKWIHAYREDWKKTKKTDGITSINEFWLDAYEKYFNRTKARPIRTV